VLDGLLRSAVGRAGELEPGKKSGEEEKKYITDSGV